MVRRAGPRLRALVGGVEAEGWRFVAFVRLVPLFPFNLLAGAIRNIALAIGLLAAVGLLPRLVRRFRRASSSAA